MNKKLSKSKKFKFPKKLTILKPTIHSFLKENAYEDTSYKTMQPLALALIEALRLFDILSKPKKDNKLRSLFSGEESKGPNLDTALTYIRDLCNASKYGLRLRLKEPTVAFPSPHIPGPGEKYWLNKIEGISNITGKRKLTEIARLLDDIFVSICAISIHLKKRKDENPRLHWNEIYQHVCHIVDHYDYAEDFLIESINPTND